MGFYYLKGIILNTIGATIRWIYGSIWRTIFNKKKFTYSEYLNGIKNSDDYFDVNAHKLNNRLIAIVFLGVVFYFVFKLN